MSDDLNTDGNDYGHDGDSTISSADVNRAAANAFKRGGDAMLNAEIGKNKKFLGFWTMDAGIADMLEGAYNVGADFLSTEVRPHIRTLVEKHAVTIPGVTPGAAKTAGIAASVGSTVLLKTGAYFGPIYDGMRSQFKEQSALARKLAPVLDEIKGNHSLPALYTTGIKDNEIIFAHRKRLTQIADNKNLNNLTNLFVSSGTSLLLDIKAIHNEIKGTPAYVAPIPADPAGAAQHSNMNGALQALKVGGVGMLPQVAQRIAMTNEYKLKKELQPYSALEMILELSDQISSDPTARGFTVPRSYQSPHGRREQYPLEEYLMRICIQHQKDMSYLDPQHTEIREALREDLAATVKPLAEAIRKGDYDAMGLVRLVGEGKIIKKQGRAIASPAEIEAILEKEEPKQTIYKPVDPAEYYKDVTFSRSQLKAALKTLEGDDKRAFAAMFPDSILTEAGMTKDEVKALRKETANQYDKVLAEAILGLNEKSDEVLKTEGLAHSEIEQIRKAAAAIGAEGVTAVHDLKASAVNEHGIETLLANVMVHQPKYLGKLREDGHNKLQDQPVADDEQDHAGRETNRRATGQNAAEAQLG